MPYKRRKRRSRSRGPAPSSATYEIFDRKDVTVSSNATTILWNSVPDTPVENVSGETQNRKIVSIHGPVELIAQLSPGDYIRLVTGWSVWPQGRPYPTVAEWDPFDTSNVPETAGYEPSPSLFGVRRILHALPSGASAAAIGTADSMYVRPNRLLKPGFELRHVSYARGTAKVSWAVEVGVRVEG